MLTTRLCSVTWFPLKRNEQVSYEVKINNTKLSKYKSNVEFSFGIFCVFFHFKSALMPEWAYRRIITRNYCQKYHIPIIFQNKTPNFDVYGFVHHQQSTFMCFVLFICYFYYFYVLCIYMSVVVTTYRFREGSKEKKKTLQPWIYVFICDLFYFHWVQFKAMKISGFTLNRHRNISEFEPFLLWCTSSSESVFSFLLSLSLIWSLNRPTEYIRFDFLSNDPSSLICLICYLCVTVFMCRTKD